MPQPDISIPEEFAYGQPRDIFTNIRRVTAPNPSVFTGPGTNSYLVGSHEDYTVIDPGPKIDRHLDALVAAAGGEPSNIKRIIATHTHPDHSPACAPLAKRTGAKIYGMHPTTGVQDRTFSPDVVLEDGMVIQGPGHRLLCIHTPGHASNHFCLLMQEAGVLFTGDHIMSGSTVVIAPPDGDMSAYLESLESLFSHDISALAPAHGSVIDDPDKAIKGLIRHRLSREAKVLKCLRRQAITAIDELVTFVYDDVDSRLHAIAKSSLLAHLQRLEGLGQAAVTGSIWRAL